MEMSANKILYYVLNVTCFIYFAVREVKKKSKNKRNMYSLIIPKLWESFLPSSQRNLRTGERDPYGKRNWKRDIGSFHYHCSWFLSHSFIASVKTENKRIIALTLHHIKTITYICGLGKWTEVKNNFLNYFCYQVRNNSGNIVTIFEFRNLLLAWTYMSAHDFYLLFLYCYLQLLYQKSIQE